MSPVYRYAASMATHFQREKSPSGAVHVKLAPRESNGRNHLPPAAKRRNRNPSPPQIEAGHMGEFFASIRPGTTGASLSKNTRELPSPHHAQTTASTAYVDPSMRQLSRTPLAYTAVCVTHPPGSNHSECRYLLCLGHQLSRHSNASSAFAIHELQSMTR